MKLSLKIAALALCAALALPLAACRDSGGKGDVIPPGGTFDRSYSAYNLDEYIKLSEYKGVPVTLASPVITDEMVEERITSLINSRATTETRLEGKVEEGVLVSINYAGTIDGKADEAITAEDGVLLVGAGSFIDLDGFEEGLIGHEVGETFSLDLKFPEEYSDPVYSGKEVTFEVTINHILDVIYPEFDEAFVASVSDEQKTPDEYREYIRQVLAGQAEATYENEKRNLIWSKVIEDSEIIKYPETELNYYKDDFINYYTEAAVSSGSTLADYLMDSYGVEYADFEADAITYAKDYVKSDLVFRAIVAKEGLAVDENEYAEGLASYFASSEGMFATEDEFTEYYGEDFIKDNLLWYEMMTLLSEASVVSYN